jgi:hypothetical protein
VYNATEIILAKVFQNFRTISPFPYSKQFM